MEEVDISIYAPACLAGKSETFTGVHAWTYGKFLYKTLYVICIFFLTFTLLKGWGDGTTTGILKEMRTKVLSKGECRKTLNDEICTYSPPGHSVAGVSIYEFEKGLKYD